MELEKNKIKQSPTGATSLLSTEIESNLQNEQVQDQIPSSTIENGSGTAPKYIYIFLYFFFPFLLLNINHFFKI